MCSSLRGNRDLRGGGGGVGVKAEGWGSGVGVKAEGWYVKRLKLHVVLNSNVR